MFESRSFFRDLGAFATALAIGIVATLPIHDALVAQQSAAAIPRIEWIGRSVEEARLQQQLQELQEQLDRASRPLVPRKGDFPPPAPYHANLD